LGAGVTWTGNLCVRRAAYWKCAAGRTPCAQCEDLESIGADGKTVGPAIATGADRQPDSSDIRSGKPSFIFRGRSRPHPSGRSENSIWRADSPAAMLIMEATAGAILGPAGPEAAGLPDGRSGAEDAGAGMLEYRGRRDHRSSFAFRIELGEIDYMLRSHAACARCVVLGGSAGRQTVVSLCGASPRSGVWGGRLTAIWAKAAGIYGFLRRSCAGRTGPDVEWQGDRQACRRPGISGPG